MDKQRIPALDWWSVNVAGPPQNVIDAMLSVGIRDVLHHAHIDPRGSISGRVRATVDQIHAWSWMTPKWVADIDAPATRLYHGVVYDTSDAQKRRPGSLCSYSRLGGPNGPWLPTAMPVPPDHELAHLNPK